MASCTDFENSIKSGITVSRDVISQPYISHLTYGIQDSIDRMKKDNFYNSDKGTITGSIADLEKLDKAIEETNILYKMYPEKKELMKKILREMDDLKTNKMKMDSSLIARDCNTYNDNLEAAKEAVRLQDMEDLRKRYNSNPAVLSKTFSVGTKDGGTTTKTLKYHEVLDEQLHRLSAPHLTYYGSYSVLDEKKDKIDFNSPGSFKNVTGSVLKTIQNASEILEKKLNGRNIKPGKLSQRPEHNKYNK